MAYLLDADALIEARKRWYGFDFCPAYWDWLVAENAAARVFSIEKISDEIEVGGDDLSAWAAARGPAFFLKPDAAVLPALRKVSDWATGQDYDAAAVNTFLQAADYYLVGQALAHGHTVVTLELPATSRKKIKIPDACIGLGVKCMSPFDMLRVSHARFVLENVP